MIKIILFKKQKMKLIIDLDSCVYAAAGAAQTKNIDTKEIIVAPVSHALNNAKSKIQKILNRFEINKDNTDRYESYLTTSNDKECFRTKLYTEYKANRKKYSKPIHYQAVRDYYVKKWNAQIVSGIEADDAVCMEQYKCYSNIWVENNEYEEITIDKLNYLIKTKVLPSIICGIDKDLDQIPGLHYNYRNDHVYYITPLQGCRNFYKQMLVGDTSDNILRIVSRWKKKNTFKLLDKALSEEEIKNIVWNEVIHINNERKDKIYSTVLCQLGMKSFNWDSYNIELTKKDLNIRGKLLYLKRFEGDDYVW